MARGKKRRIDHAHAILLALADLGVSAEEMLELGYDQSLVNAATQGAEPLIQAVNEDGAAEMLLTSFANGELRGYDDLGAWFEDQCSYSGESACWQLLEDLQSRGVARVDDFELCAMDQAAFAGAFAVFKTQRLAA
jgi:hypothetical protein